MIKKTFDRKQDLEQALSIEILKALKEGILKKGYASILFSGGSTPKALMNHLATLEMDWSKVRVSLVDDRMVEPTSEFLNWTLLEQEFLNRIPGALPQCFPLVSNSENLEENKNTALEWLSNFEALDVVLLGMGTDGHFASLFPNDGASAKALEANFEAALVYTQAPSFPQQRISFSWPFLKKATQIYLHITGAAKETLLNQERSKETLPIDTLKNCKEPMITVYWAL